MSHAVRMPVVAAVSVAVVAGTVVAGVGLSAWTTSPTSLQVALATMPAQTVTASFTDWKQARAALGSVGPARAPARAQRGFLDSAYDRDFSAASVLAAEASTMSTAFGWNVLDVDWEMYGQSRDGAVGVVKVPDGFDFADAASALDRLGFPAPGESGVRAAGSDVLAASAPGVTPQLSNIALLPDERIVVFSDDAAYAASTVEVITGGSDALASVDGVASLASRVDSSAVSAVLHAGPRGCEVAGFAEAGAATRRVAVRLLRRAGGVHDYDGLVLALGSDGSLTVAMHYRSPSGANADLAARTSLAQGAAPAQGGSFRDRFTVRAARVQGGDVVLTLDPRTADAHLLSDLGRGGLLFAACS